MTTTANGTNGVAAPSVNGTSVQRDPWVILREPFPPSAIGKLPRVTCRVCSDKKAECGQHKKQRCGVCGNWVSTAHVHLDYVGHAACTDRLLKADPEWSWEPVERDTRGELGELLKAAVATGNPEMVDRILAMAPPKPDANGGLWIRLTVAGVTRLGYGDADGRVGPDAVKVAIGDALRNGAMRFGVALDLWAKEDLTAESGGEARGPLVSAQQSAGQQAAEHPADRDDAQPGTGEAQMLADTAQRTKGLKALKGVHDQGVRKSLLEAQVRNAAGEEMTLLELITVKRVELEQQEPS